MEKKTAIWLNNIFVWGEKSNETWPSVQLISQGQTLCDLSDAI
jgi:hypothetical protein